MYNSHIYKIHICQKFNSLKSEGISNILKQVKNPKAY